MRKYLLISLIGAVIILSYSLYGTMTRSVSVQTNGIETEKELPAFDEITYYTVKDHCGKIGIFESGKDSPSAVLDVYVFTLPYVDRNMLEHGFTVDENSVIGIIEDYTG